MLGRTTVLALLASLSFTTTAYAGQQTGRVYGLNDTDIPTPVHSPRTVSDPAAIQALIGFVKMAGVLGWKGATATGLVTFGDQPTPYAATVSWLGAGQSRMDVKKDAGTESTIISGSRGVFKPVSGTQSSISSDIATVGLFGFLRLVSPDYPQKTSVLSDQGQVSIGGRNLHRITLDDPSPDGQGTPWKTIDLYFDPKTGELAESVAFVHLSSADAALYTLETSYSGYETVHGVTLPHTFAQSLNGQPQWTLTLTSIDMSVPPPASLFTF